MQLDISGGVSINKHVTKMAVFRLVLRLLSCLSALLLSCGPGTLQLTGANVKALLQTSTLRFTTFGRSQCKNKAHTEGFLCSLFDTIMLVMS